MTPKSRSIDDYLKDMRDSARMITSFVQQHGESGLNDVILMDHVERRLEIIGEAANMLGKKFPKFAEANPQLEIKGYAGMRNIIAHQYFRVDKDLVWKTLSKDIPILVENLDKVAAERQAMFRAKSQQNGYGL